MAVLVQTRTFFILAALLGRFVTIKAQEVEEYEGGEFLSTSKTITIIPPLCMRCVYCVIWLISGAENLWDRRARLLLSRFEKGAERGLRLGFLSGRLRFAALAAGTEREGRSKAKCCRGALGLSPRPGGAAAAGEFPTKERAWDAAGGQLGERAGRVNSEASQGGVVCAELHLLSHILCFREMQKRGFSLFHPSPSSFSFHFHFFPTRARFPPGSCGGAAWRLGWHGASSPPGSGGAGQRRLGASSVRAGALASCEPRPPDLPWLRLLGSPSCSVPFQCLRGRHWWAGEGVVTVLSSVGMDVVICVDFLKCEQTGGGTLWSYCTPERTS